jgi:hypothetical protein
MKRAKKKEETEAGGGGGMGSSSQSVTRQGTESPIALHRGSTTQQGTPNKQLRFQH